MLVTIYYKKSEITSINYNMTLEEFRRLASDYTRFLQTGEPKQGVYLCRTVHGDPEFRTPIETLLIFADIAVIS
jgi:hypothetical protein